MVGDITLLHNLPKIFFLIPIILISLFATPALALPPASAGIYYVRTDGNDLNSGTENTPQGAWAAMQKAGYVFGGWKFGGEGKTIFCSQFTGKVYGEAGVSGIWGIGPNTQYYQWRMQGK